MNLGGAFLGLLSYISSSPTDIDEQVLIKRQQCLKTYFVAQEKWCVAEKELPRYLETLLDELTSDALYGILSKYLLLINETRQDVLYTTIIPRYIAQPVVAHCSFTQEQKTSRDPRVNYKGDLSINVGKKIVTYQLGEQKSLSMLTVFSLKNDGMQRVISDYELPFCPKNAYFMKDDYLLLEHNGRGGCPGFLHLQIVRDDNDGYYIKEIKRVVGIGYTVREVNEHFYSAWNGKDFRLVAYDGSTIVDVERFEEFRSQFGLNGRYYAATSSGEWDREESRYIQEPKLLLLSLHPWEKKAHIIKCDEIETGHFCNHVAFHDSLPFFITYDEKNCFLRDISGKIVYGFNNEKANFNFSFAPDGLGIAIGDRSVHHGSKRDVQLQQHMLVADEVIKSLPAEHLMGFADYFLLKNNISDDACKATLVAYAQEDYKRIAGVQQ